MRFLRKSLMGLFITAVTLGLLAYAGTIIFDAVEQRAAKERRGPPARERTFTVPVDVAQPGTEIPILEAFGEVQSRRTLELRASAGGRVIELAPEFVDGGEVREGQVLALIDPATAQSAFDRAAADVADAQAEVRDADRALALARDELKAAQNQEELQARALRRQMDLQARGVVTAAAVENAELALSSASQAVLARRQAVTQGEARIDLSATRLTRSNIALAEAQRNLDDTRVIAPFDGTLSEVAVVEGRLVAPNEKLAALIDPDRLEVAFRLSTAQYTRLLDDAGALVQADVQIGIDVSGIDLTTSGRISRVSAGAGTRQTGRLVFAQIDQPRGFKPGDFVTTSVTELPLENVVRLPSGAVDSANEVLVVGADSRLEALPVEVLRRQGDDVLVRGRGLAGRQVVRARSPALGAGIAVRPVIDGAGPEAASAQPELLELSQERRARLVAFVEENSRMPEDVKARVLAQLSEPEVPARMVARLESRMGG